MSAVSDLIERNSGDSMAIIAGLLGAMSRHFGQLPDGCTEKDDVTAGVLILDQMSERDGKSDRVLVAVLEGMLVAGITPADVKELAG